MDFWISDWISGFHSGFLDFWISQWISGFQFGFLPTVYEISFVTDPSDRASHARSLGYSRFQTNDRGLWSGNETSCAHAYKIRKWRPKQRTAAS